MNLQLIQQIGEVIGVLFGSGGVIYLLWNGFKRLRNGVARTSKFVKDVDGAMTIVRKELAPNGGRSIRDIVMKLDSRQAVADKLITLMSDQMKIGMFLNDADGHCRWTNSVYDELTGRDSALSMGEGWRNALHPDDAEHVFMMWDLAVRTKSNFNMKYKLLRPNGTVQEVYCKAEPIFGGDGTTVTAWFGHLSPVNP